MEHSLRTLPEYFQAVKRGDKLFELRFDDRGYAAGDTLLLREYEPIGDHYSGDTVRVRVTYSLRGAPWLAPGYVAMSIQLIDEAAQSHPPTDAAQLDAQRKATQQAQALAADWQAQADLQRDEIEALKEENEHMWDAYLVHQTILPDGALGMDARTVLTENIEQRDQLITLLAARSAADREIGHLTGERDELKRQLDELSQLVGAEKAAYQDQIEAMHARWDVLTEQYTQEALRRSQAEQERRALCDVLSADSATVAGQSLADAVMEIRAQRDGMSDALAYSAAQFNELQAHWERAQTALRNARIYVDRMTIQVGPVAHDELWQAKRALQLIDAVLEEQADV